MNLARIFTLFGFITVAAPLALAGQGCGGDDASGNKGNGSDGGTGGPGGTTGEPPAKPSAGATTSTAERNFAVYELLLGDATRNGPESDIAWKTFGYNLDGKVSTARSNDGCKPVAGASPKVKDDGENGIDNSFGANVVPLITGAQADAPAMVNRTFTNGDFTLLFDVTGLSDEATQTATGLSGIVLAGGDFGSGQPTFTKADNWPVRPELLSNPSDAKSSTVRFSDAYVVNGTFVARADLKLNIRLGSTEIALDLKKAIVTFDHAGEKADNGTIAGVVTTEQFITQMRRVVGNLAPSLCGSGGDQIERTLREASDIMADGTAGDPSQECTGISLGIGFKASEIAVPSTVAPATPPGEDKCATK
jgi:hypothetical protein